MPRILFVQTFYPEFLQHFHESSSNLGLFDFDAWRTALFATFFGVGDAYSHFVRSCGWDAQEVVCNADVVQECWARERGLALSGNIHDRRRQIVASQVRHLRPDVLYVFEWSPLGDRFLEEMSREVPLIVGQVASPLPSNRTFAAYDLIISSYPPIVDHFRATGHRAELLRFAFDERVLDHLPSAPVRHDVTFVGGFAPSHEHRIPWLERLLTGIDVDLYGYALDSVPRSSPLHRHHRGQVWGRDMYEILIRSRITLNRHARIDLPGVPPLGHANNMRLFEATGVGTCLMTEAHENLSSMFRPDTEVLTYREEGECLDKLRYYLTHESERRSIAQSGRTRTHREHLYRHRMRELSDLLHRLMHTSARSVPQRSIRG